VAGAAANIAELTGIVRKPTQVRPYVRALGLKPMNVLRLPAQADVAARAAFQKSLETRLQAAGAGERAVLSIAAAHLVFAPSLGMVWGCQRLVVKAPSER
jgi:hypothetical protein